jgi:acyl-CoA synthetase (AMP-forming)/AMP-acid ligase II
LKGSIVNSFVGKTFGQSLDLLATRFGGREALVFGEGRWTFQQVRAEVQRAAARIGTLGLQPGDKIAIWLDNRPEFVWYWLAACEMGLVAVLMNTRLRPDEAAYQIHQSDSRALLTGISDIRNFINDIADLIPELKEGRPLQSATFPALQHLVTFDTPHLPLPAIIDWSREAIDLPPTPPAVTDPDQPAMICYSSGTTALPKGVMLRHCVWRKAADHGGRFNQTADDRLLLCVPLFGVLANVNGLMTFWTRGSCVVLTERFDPEEALSLIQRERCSAAYLFPVMVEKMVNQLQRGSYDLSSLRTGIVVTGDAQVIDWAVNGLGMTEMFASYGMTETSSAVVRTFGTDSLEIRLNSHGKPLPDIEVRIADPDTGAPVPTGVIGEIQVRSYCVMAGYYKKPEETRHAFTADGWFKTGDAGRFRDDGNMQFVRRLNDGYKHKGFNVSVSEVEAVLREHPSIEAAAVVGIPHRTFGEIGVAFVIPAAGQNVVADEIVSFLKPKLASYKLPNRVIAIDAFPTTAGTGKVQKSRLREIAAREKAGLAASPIGQG